MLICRSLRIAVVVLAVGSLGRGEHACTAFVLTTGQRVLVGRNLDVSKAFAAGYLMSNREGGSRRSVLEDSRRPATWTVKHGSVTFNLFGRGFPVGGMNAAGLVVEHLALPATTYPRAEGKPMMLEFEWVQYMLDAASSVKELLSSARQAAIAPERIKMHFMACDASGDCALIEFIDGTAVTYRGRDFTPPAITNSTYSSSVKYLAGFAGHGGERPLPHGSRKSLDRFVVAADQVLAFHKRPADARAIDTSFAILKSVPNNTLLSVVYDVTNLKIHYTTRRNANRRTVSLAARQRSRSSRDGGIEPEVKARDRRRMRPFVEVPQRRDRTQDPVAAGQHFFDGLPSAIDLSAEAEGIMLDMHAGTSEVKPFSVDANSRSIEAVVPGHRFLRLDRYVEKMKLGAK